VKLRLPDPALSWAGASLRPWHADDADQLVHAWCDPEIARWNPVPSDPSAERASVWLDRYDDRVANRLALDLVIVEDGVVMGEVGIANIDAGRRAALIGYWLLPDGRGRGLAAQALAVFSAWLLEDLGLDLLVARCAVANEASQRVAAHAGYVHRRDDDKGHQLWARTS